MSPEHTLADCGELFDHAPHVYRSPRGKVLACDGSVTKRAPRPKPSPYCTCAERGCSDFGRQS